MKLCIIFRGDNLREEGHKENKRKYTDILMCWDNIQKTICTDLTDNGYSYDIVFITYNTSIIERIKETIKPKHMLLYNRTTQHENVKHCCEFMNNHSLEYSRYIVLRCDFRYKLKITQWPKWNNNGILVINRDVHWPTQKLYADIVFIVDSSHCQIFLEAHLGDNYMDLVHGLPRYLFNNNIEFHLMYDGYFHMDCHPLHSQSSVESDPDLSVVHPPEYYSLKCVSQWN